MIAEKILDAIIARQFKVGDALPSERELSGQFGVSRTVIREAIRSLSTKGVVEVQSGRGVQVLPLDAAPVTEAMSLLLRLTPDVSFNMMHEVRLMLETHVAGVAAQRATEDDLATLDDLLERMTEVVNAHGSSGMSHRDFDLAQRPDWELHRGIAKAAQNGLYLVMLDSISSIIFEVRAAIFAHFDGPYPFLDEYRAIVNAIKRRDPDGARKAMEAHLTHVWKVWHEHLASEAAR
jgi:GntR family transcriptional repressor for pyruvate dehydrogenase complex